MGAHSALSIPTPVRREPADESFGAVVSRQFSLWPFGTRVLRLYALADPSGGDARLTGGLLRAMQLEYFRSESGSQTNALRGALRAVHYALRHRNQASLPHERVTAASACAVTRGGTAYVALSGEAVALAWNGSTLQTHRATSRAARPLGTETAPPRITLWSTPLAEQDLLILACGAAWSDGTVQAVESVLRAGGHRDDVAQDLTRVLGGSHGPARVLVAEGVPDVRSRFLFARRRDRVAARRTAESGDDRAATSRAESTAGHRITGPRRVRAAALGAGLAAALVLAGSALGVPDLVGDRAAALGIATVAEHLGVTHALSAAPTNAVHVTPTLVAALGNDAASIMDLAVSDAQAFVLDAADQTVRRFALDRADQPLTSDTIVARGGATISGRAMGAPVGLAVSRGLDGADVLSVVEQRRRVLQADAGGNTRWTTPAATLKWQSVACVIAAGDTLYVLDGQGGTLHAFDRASQGLGTARVVLDSQTAPNVPFGTSVDVAPLGGEFWFLQQDGVVRRFDEHGTEHGFAVHGTATLPARVSSITSDDRDTLFLADPANDRVVLMHTDGAVVREVLPARRGDFMSLRQIELAPGGAHLYGVTDAGLLDIPLAVPPRP